MQDHSAATADGDGSPLPSLLHRYLFFSWLFVDMDRARDRIERHAFWQHNRAMRKYLPTYLRRWAFLSGLAFGAGWLCEKGLETTLLAACCYTGSCMTVPVMVVIGVAWLFLSRSEFPWRSQ